MQQRLDQYKIGDFRRGRPAIIEACWMVVDALFVRSFIPGSWHRRWLLRLFGASIGRQVVLKPGVRVKFPWRLRVGDHSWIGESAWIDNLAEVEIGCFVVVSQGAYLCTGSHDWSRESFDLIVRPVTIANSAWVCAGSYVAPGTRIGEGTVVGIASCVAGDLQSWWIYRGNPAVAIKRRTIR